MRFDLHVHTALSACSSIKINEILEKAASAGLDGICITDHHTMDIRHFLTEGVQDNGLCVIFGMEYSTSDGDFLIFGPFKDIPFGLCSKELLQIVTQKGGVAIAAHPFRKERPVKESIIKSGLCAIIESFNGRNSDFENLQVNQWRNKYSFNEVAGSDAHLPEELGTVATVFNTSIRSRSELICALKKGSYHPEYGMESNISLKALAC